MKILFKIILFLLVNSAFTIYAFAQDNENSKSLVQQGIELNDAGKYDEAIEKYKEALKENPDNLQADYEMGYTLYASGKGKEAIPYLEIILKSGDSKYETYELLGSIYDDDNQHEKAIELFKKGIDEKPDFERLHFNLGVTYLKIKNYAGAEEESVAALKLDPNHASAQRLYGLATFYQGRKLCAVLAFCNFLLIEPQTQRSAEVYGYIDTILKSAAAQKTIYLQADKNAGVSAMSFAESSLIMAASAKAEFEKQNLGTPAERLNNELDMIFKTTAMESAKVVDKDFFWDFYAGFFGELEKSGNMQAFTRYISLSANKDENLAWFKEHQKELNDLGAWLKSTKREF